MKGRTIVAMGLALALCSAEASAKKRKLDGSGKNLTPEQTLASFTLPEGYQVNLFASEVDFPIASPMAMAFDARGRLWVANSPLYPHILPGQAFEDSIIILEDADGDGKADTHTVFADRLYIPTGFAIVKGGAAAYIAEVPYLTYAEDTDGDGVADRRRTVLHGFGTEDSHHALSAFEWGPGGAFYFNEGRFLHSQIETPYGPRRVRDGAVFRYKPSSQRLEVMSSYHYHNPWGHVFDRWGQSILADASDGANYYFAPLTNNFDYPRREKTRGENKPIRPFAKRGRPTAGCDIIRSRHFPDEAQGLYLVNQCIGFHGTRWHRMVEEGSGLAQAPQMEQDLLHSSDTTFRPVGMEFGPDGALYILDFYNPIVGHMQYSIRDPRRDHAHGRIWRITYPSRPLLVPPKIVGEPIPKLLDLLKVYENQTRHHARRELQEREPHDVVPVLKRWIAAQKRSDPEYEHHLLEALWVYQGLDVIEPSLLKRLLRAKDYHARAAATRMLRFWLEEIDDPLPLLRERAEDKRARVRLEAVLTCGFHPSAEAAEIALLAAKYPMDTGLTYALKSTIQVLEKYWKPAAVSGKPLAVRNPAGARFLADNIKSNASDQTEQANQDPGRSDLKVITIKAVPGGLLLYDKKQFTVKAGTPVEIIFENPDHMQHNLLIVKPGAMETVGLLADAMAAQPDATQKHFVPDTPLILWATPLLEAGEVAKLHFIAPEEPGDYPYLCTFPGHWRIMNGVMHVVASATRKQPGLPSTRRP